MCTQGQRQIGQAGLVSQVVACLFLSVAHGANNARTSLGVFTMMRALHTSGEVHETASPTWHWRLMAAAGMALGTLLFGFRLVPVSSTSA